MGALVRRLANVERDVGIFQPPILTILEVKLQLCRANGRFHTPHGRQAEPCRNRPAYGFILCWRTKVDNETTNGEHSVSCCSEVLRPIIRRSFLCPLVRGGDKGQLLEIGQAREEELAVLNTSLEGGA